MMLYCPYCESKDPGYVKLTWHKHDSKIDAVVRRRRRECSECGKRWTTVEINKDELMNYVWMNTYFVGELCVKQHKYKGQMKSLRYKSSKTCVECTKGAAGSGG